MKQQRNIENGNVEVDNFGQKKTKKTLSCNNCIFSCEEEKKIRKEEEKKYEKKKKRKFVYKV